MRYVLCSAHSLLLSRCLLLIFGLTFDLISTKCNLECTVENLEQSSPFVFSQCVFAYKKVIFISEPEFSTNAFILCKKLEVFGLLLVQKSITVRFKIISAIILHVLLEIKLRLRK